MNTEVKTEYTRVDFFEIERQARALRAEVARNGFQAMTTWIKARFASTPTAAAKHAA